MVVVAVDTEPVGARRNRGEADLARFANLRAELGTREVVAAARAEDRFPMVPPRTRADARGRIYRRAMIKILPFAMVLAGGCTDTLDPLQRGG